MIKVAVVEDDTSFRESLLCVLREAPTLKCVGAYACGEEAVLGIPKTRPDVVLMDLNLNGCSGAETTARVKEQLPKLNVLVLTAFNDTDHIFQALRAGACGYLLKRASAADIIEAVELAHQGGAPMTNEIARKVLAVFARPCSGTSEVDSLAAREKEILDLVAKGFANKQVADQLSLTVGTVRWYLHEIYRKLQVQSRTEAARLYLQSRPPGTS